MIHAQVDTTTRQILAFGYFPAGHEDPGVEIVDVDDSALADLQQSGTKTLQADGTILVVPPDPNAPDPVKEAQEAQATIQVQAAQALIATSSDQQQADAMTTFMRTLGLPL